MTRKSTDLARHEADLARADLDIAEGERRVGEQLLRLERFRRDGYDTVLAERLLHQLRGQLEQWRAHRDLIVREIASLATRPDDGRGTR
jgi:hypothetical protein